MFNDAKKALREFEAELLAEDATQKWTPEIQEREEPEVQTAKSTLTEEEQAQVELSLDELLSDQELNALLENVHAYGQTDGYRNHANDYGKIPEVYNSDDTDLDPQELADALQQPTENKKITVGLIITASVLALGILGVIAWWLTRYWGVF